MASRKRILLFSIILLIPTLILSQAPSVPAFDTANVRVSDTPPKCIKPLTVTEPDGDTYLCDLDTAQAEFAVQKLATDTEFCLYYKSGTLTPPEYDLDVSCSDKDGKGNTGVIRVYVEPNQPPDVPGGPSLDATLDVATYTTGSPVFTIPATDVDNDAITFTTTTADPNFTVDPNTGVITPAVDPRQMTATSALMTVDVSDNVPGHSPVTVNVVVTLQNLNVAPVLRNFPALSPEVTIPEDQAPGDLFVLDVDDALAVPKVTVSGTVDPASESSMFEFNDAGPYSVKLAAGKKFDAKTRSTYDVTVTLFDGFLSSPPYKITVKIQDVNDAPVFSQTTYAVEVEEGDINTRTFTATGFGATDADGDTVTYFMGAAGQSSKFTVDSANGALTNIATLDFEDATLPKPLRAEVCAKDGNGGQSCAMVDVTLKDINDNKPEFAAGAYTHKISLKTPVSTQFQQLVATDKDTGVNADIEYSLAPSCAASGLFAVVGDFITLAQAVNVAYGTPLSCDVVATDKGVNPGPLESDTQTISFIWNEAPDCGPDVTKSISQNTAAGTFVHTLAVTDPEGDAFGCTVASSNPDPAPFSAAVETGTTYGIKFDGGPLDSTVQPTYVLTVECSDGNGGKDTQVTTINIDPNQQPNPACDPSDSKTLDVNTPVPANTDVYDFAVTDADNDPITISITENPATGLFTVNQGSGKLEVTKDLRAEDQSSYTLNVDVNDGKTPAVTCVLTISIKNLNQAPKITNDGEKVQWSENTPVGTALLSLNIQDTDTTTVTMAISPTSGSTLFELDPATNKIKLKSALDYETMADKLFDVVVVVDDGFKQTTGTVTIEVLDDNDPPKFTSATFTATVDEGPTNAITVDASIAFTDSDAGDTHTFSILPGKDGAKFSIDAATGKLTNVEELDVDNGQPTQLKVDIKVTDGAGLSDTAEAIITIKEINDNDPKFDATNPVTPALVSIGLSMPATTTIATLSASDLDLGDKASDALVFNMASTSTECGYFSVNPNTGVVTLKKTLDSSLYGNLISCDVTVEDKRAPIRKSTYQLDIGWNKPPSIDNLKDQVTVKESQTLLKDLFTVQVSDPENDNFDCTNKLPTSPPDIPFEVRKNADKDFHVWYNTEKALTLGPGVPSQYTLTVVCTDSEGGSDTKDLVINVKKNQPPVITDCSPRKNLPAVDAGATGANVDIYTVTATEPEGDNVIFKLNSISPGSAQFALGLSGTISTTGDLKMDTSGANLVTLEVVAEDPEKNAATCVITIPLTNVNVPPKVDNLPQTVTVPEDAAAGSEIYSIKMTDAVLCGSDITVNWKLENYPELSSLFTVVVTGTTASVKLAPGKTLDFEDPIYAGLPPVLRFTFTASDGCLTSTKSELRVQIQDINEDPVMRKGNKYSATFYENDTDATVTLGCDVFDIDKDDVLSITLTGANADKFKITDPYNCVLTKTKELDLDTNASPQSTIKMIVEDKGGLKVEADIDLLILEANEHTPIYTTPTESYTITEGDPAGRVLGTMAATDKDRPGSLDSSLTHTVKSMSPATGDQYITMDSNGQIKIKEPLDGKVANGETFKLEVEVCDQGYPKKCSSGYVDVQYIVPPTTPPPVTQDPNNNNNNNNNNGNGAGSGGGSGGSGSGASGSLLDNPGIIAMMALLLAAGAGLAALGIFGAYKLWSRGGCTKGAGNSSPKHYDVSDRAASRGSNNASRGSNRVRDSTDIQMTDASGDATKWVYTGTSVQYEPVQSMTAVETVPVAHPPVASSVHLL